MKLLMSDLKISCINEVYVCVNRNSVWIVRNEVTIVVRIQCDTHSFNEWMNLMINNGGFHGGHSIWVEIKCLDHPLLFIMNFNEWKRGILGVNTLCELRWSAKYQPHYSQKLSQIVWMLNTLRELRYGVQK